MKREITISEILKMLRAHIKLIVIITLVGGILAYAYSAYMITPMYSTSTLLYVTNSDELPGDSTTTSSSVDNTDSSEVRKSGSNDIIISSRIAQVCMTLFKTDLMMNELIEYLDLSLSPGQLKGMISVTASEDTQFLRVSVTGTDPEALFLRHLFRKQARAAACPLYWGQTIPQNRQSRKARRLLQFAQHAFSSIPPLYSRR